MSWCSSESSRATMPFCPVRVYVASCALLPNRFAKSPPQSCHVAVARDCGEFRMAGKVSPRQHFRNLLFVAFSYLGFKMIRNLSPATVESGLVLCANLSKIFQLQNGDTASARAKRASSQRHNEENAKQQRCSIARAVVLFGDA